MRIKKGNIVKLKSGIEGMVVWYKSNEEIGLNTGHYWIAKNRTPGAERDKLMNGIKDGKLGMDTEVTKEEIEKVL